MHTVGSAAVLGDGKPPTSLHRPHLRVRRPRRSPSLQSEYIPLAVGGCLWFAFQGAAQGSQPLCSPGAEPSESKRPYITIAVNRVFLVI